MSAALRWLPTFLGFPVGGYLAELVAGPVDGLAAALLAGAIAGIILGAAQSWAIGEGGPPPLLWAIAAAGGLTVGLALGSASTGYGTSFAELMLQGAICGLAIGGAQVLLLRPRLGRIAYLWAPALGALWAIGWATSTTIGIDVESQWAVFGASGALVVTGATAVLPVLLAATTARSAS